jgi:hypothetical protein
MNTFAILSFLAAIQMASGATSEPADAAAVMDNLLNYSKLYVTYQNCAWSPYTANNNNNACGNGGDYWYMGLTECFRSNVAYSLYGVLKDQEDTGCNKKTFINSFFTTSGIDSFTSYMTTAGITFSADADGAYVTSACTVDNSNNNNGQNQDDGSSSTGNNVKINAMSTSYGVGCADKSKGFEMKKYGGAYCDEREVREVTDAMDTFNSEMSGVQCIAIYDAAAEADNNNQNNNGGSASDILAYSEACNVMLFPDQCPDPYGKLRSASRASAHTMSVNSHPRREMVKTVFSWLLMGFGILLIAASAMVYFRKMKAMESSKDPNATKKRSIFARMGRKGETNGEKKKATTASDNKPGLFTRLKGKLARSSSTN